MPKRMMRSAKAPPSAQFRRPTSGNKETLVGKSELDGRKNTNAGTTHSALPSTLNGKAVVVRTYGS